LSTDAGSRGVRVGGGCHEEAARSKYKNAAEALDAFGDLFESDEEAEEFADYIDQMREEERARYRD
jgi:hypothetical protein